MISVKNNGGGISTDRNKRPVVTELRRNTATRDKIEITYKVNDEELTICRHYLTVRTTSAIVINKKEITRDVGYESPSNVFRYLIEGLIEDTTYTIQITCSDGLDEGVSEAIQVQTGGALSYTICIDESNSNPANMVSYAGNYGASNWGNWQNKWPFNKVRLVGLKEGRETKEIDPTNKKQYTDGSPVPADVDVMVRIPKIYYGFEKTGNGYNIKISDKKISGTDCFAHKISGQEKDNIHIGAYLACEEGGKLRSKSGVLPITIDGRMVEHFRRYAQYCGYGYQQWNVRMLELLRVLFLLVYKNMNSQQALGFGRFGEKSLTGGLDDAGYCYGAQNQAIQVCFLGIEDVWGNYSQVIDGLKVENNTISIVSDNYDFDNSYETIGQANSNVANGSGFVKNVMGTSKGGFFPADLGGTSTTYYCDIGGFRGNTFFASGGVGIDSRHIDRLGIFAMDGLESITDRTRVSTRLCYFG